MGPYRLVKRSGIRAEDDDPVQKRLDNISAYTDRLLRLIPGDVVAAYLTVKGLYAGDDDPAAASVIEFWLPGIGLVLTLLLRVLGTPTRPFLWKEVQWPVVAISAVAFLVWVSVTQDRLWSIDIDPRHAAGLLVLFTFLPPLVLRGSQA